MQTEFKKSIYKPKEKFEMRHVIVGVLLIVLLLFLIFGLTDKGTSYTDGTLIINELMISNRSTIIDDDGQFSDWIEIYNSNDYSINLEGFGLSDDRKSPFKWRFPRVTIGPKQHLLIFASGKDKKEAEKGYLHTNFKLNSKGENLILSNKNGQIVDQVKIPELVSDISYGRQSEDNEKWVYFDKPTPNNDNSGTGSEQPLKDAAVIDSPVYINEVIVSNKTSIVDEDGEHSDWIEIFNSGDTPIGLKGYGLSDDKNDPLKWRFPDITINPGEYALIFASGKNRSEPNHKNIHTNFKLNSENEFLLFSNSYGQIIDRILLKEMKSNISYGRKPEGKNEWLYFTSPTPGEENSTQGFGSLAANYPVREKQLLLNEAMATNKTSITDEDGEHSDWIEIYNPTDEPINLKDYGLSNDKYDPFKWKFPDVSIAPKGYMIIFASGKNKFGGGKVHTNFKISSSGENIILCDKSRNIIDEFNTGRLEVDTSRGRKIDDNEKLVFYTKATPGAENNGTGYAGYAPEPQVSHKG